MTTRVLVAGIGNIFFHDDGFGPAVTAELLAAATPMPTGVRVVDYGIRGMHLAYDLGDTVDTLVLIDTVPGAASTGGPAVLGGPTWQPAGTVSVLRVGPEDLNTDNRGTGEFDAHGMNPAAMLASLESIGGSLPTTYLVGCVPADLGEGIGLSDPVAAAVPDACRAVARLVADVTVGRVDAVPVRAGERAG